MSVTIVSLARVLCRIFTDLELNLQEGKDAAMPERRRCFEVGQR